VQELKKQNIMIEELDGKMDTVTEKLETVNDKMKKTLEKVNTTTQLLSHSQNLSHSRSLVSAALILTNDPRCVRSCQTDWSPVRQVLHGHHLFGHSARRCQRDLQHGEVSSEQGGAGAVRPWKRLYSFQLFLVPGGGGAA
jgi:hypothetical protein